MAIQRFSPEALRARRKQLGLQREALAFAIGRTVVTIGNYECGRTRPSPEDLQRIAACLRCDPSDFFVEDGARA